MEPDVGGSETPPSPDLTEVAKEMLDKSGITDAKLREIARLAHVRDREYSASKKETARQLVYLAFVFEAMRAMFNSESSWHRFLRNHFKHHTRTAALLLKIAAAFNYDKTYLEFLRRHRQPIPPARSFQGTVTVLTQLRDIEDYIDLLLRFSPKRTNGTGSEPKTNGIDASPEAKAEEKAEVLGSEAPASDADAFRNEILQRLVAKVPASALSAFEKEFSAALGRCPDLASAGDKGMLAVIRAALLPAVSVLERIPA
jgi:hypothetical protein